LTLFFYPATSTGLDSSFLVSNGLGFQVDGKGPLPKFPAVEEKTFQELFASLLSHKLQQREINQNSFRTTIIFFAMTYSSKQQQNQEPAGWDHSTSMLASSIMMMSISEESTLSDLGYTSRLSSSSSGCPSQGWGSQLGRTSCKVDLCALGQTNPKEFSSQHSSPSNDTMDEEDDWGFFDESH